jgi:hypothetical protein
MGTSHAICRALIQDAIQSTRRVGHHRYIDRPHPARAAHATEPPSDGVFLPAIPGGASYHHTYPRVMPGRLEQACQPPSRPTDRAVRSGGMWTCVMSYWSQRTSRLLSARRKRPLAWRGGHLGAPGPQFRVTAGLLADIAGHIGAHEQTVCVWIKRGDLPASTFGTRIGAAAALTTPSSPAAPSPVR